MNKSVNKLELENVQAQLAKGRSALFHLWQKAQQSNSTNTEKLWNLYMQMLEIQKAL